MVVDRQGLGIGWSNEKKFQGVNQPGIGLVFGLPIAHRIPAGQGYLRNHFHRYDFSQLIALCSPFSN
jgi:hypothetical protein